MRGCTVSADYCTCDAISEHKFFKEHFARALKRPISPDPSPPVQILHAEPESPKLEFGISDMTSP